MSDLNLPPRRPMPPEVRERLRTRLAEPPRPTRLTRARAPLVAAAAVAVLALGAVLVAGYGSPPPTPPSSQPVPPLERCWNTLLDEGKADRYPAFSTWRQVATDRTRTSVITSVLADEKPIFCVTTDSSVTVTDPTAPPRYGEDSRAALLLVRQGWIAGLADPAWGQIGIRVEGGPVTLVTPKEGMFAIPHRWSPQVEVFGTEPDRFVYPDPGHGIALPLPPSPAVGVFDDPGVAAAMARASLGECVDRAPAALKHRPWEVGVHLGSPGLPSELVMARGEDRVGMCLRRSDGQFEFTDLGVVAHDVPRQLVPAFRFETVGGYRWVIMGVVPDGTTSMRITLTGGARIQIMAVNGTFALSLPAHSADERGNLAAKMVPKAVRALGSDNTVLYDGPLHLR